MLVGRRISLRWVASLVAMASCIVIYPAAAEDRAPYEPQLLGFEIEVEGVAVWRGAPAVIELYPALSSHGSAPGGVARISFDGLDERGLPLGVYFEITPESLRSARWSIDLRGDEATRPGLGVLSYRDARARTVIRHGSLTANRAGSTLSGSFESDSKVLASGDFRGSYTIACFVRIAPATGRLSEGATMWRRDSEFESSFCAPFGPGR